MGICPILMQSFITANEDLKDHEERVQKALIRLGSACIGPECQIWNPETKDCGLKQTPVAQILTEMKSTLEDISNNVDIIRCNND